MKKTWLLFIISIISRIPFLFLGYGNEEDSWGHVVNIWEMIHKDQYIMSRLPGHPVFEGILYLLWPIHSPFVYNLILAISGAFAVVYFYKIAAHYKIGNAFWLSLGFGFIPVVFLSSTYTIDYMLGMALVLASMYYLLLNKWLLSAVLLAFAIGTRLTWLLMFIPFAGIISRFQFKTESIIPILRFSGVLGGLVIILLFPLFYEYGYSFLNTYSLPYPPLAKAVYKGTLGAWGLIGLITLSWAMFKIVFNDLKKGVNISRDEFIWLIPVFLYALLYIRLPEKAAFTLPIIPFLLLLIANRISMKSVLYFSIGLMISGLFLGINIEEPLRGSTPSSLSFSKEVEGQKIFLDLIKGPYALEQSKRENKLAYVRKFTREAKFEKPTVLIAGWWYAMIKTETEIDKNESTIDNLTLSYYLSDKEIQDFKSKGYSIQYLPGQDVVNIQRNNTTLTSELSNPFQF